MKKFNNHKKGFTLVEVIVVLVIIAILIAIAVPSLTGYIKKANEKVMLADARTILMAAQTIASENYAKGDKTEITQAAIEALAGTKFDGKFGKQIKVENGTVVSFNYTKGTILVTFSYGNLSVKTQ